VDHQPFYEQLLAPIEAEFGPVDPMTIAAIIGFDAGGPLGFRTFGGQTGSACITYVSCELAIREDQRLRNLDGTNCWPPATIKRGSVQSCQTSVE
jgi:hypothetical protein